VISAAATSDDGVAGILSVLGAGIVRDSVRLINQELPGCPIQTAPASYFEITSTLLAERPQMEASYMAYTSAGMATNVPTWVTRAR
jgi:hypothetical protein